MALSIPLPINDFQDKLDIVEFQMPLSEPTQETRLEDGTIIRASLGEALWQGEATVRVDRHSKAAQFEALLSLATRPGVSVFLTDPRKPYPTKDPGGGIVQGSSVTISAISSSRREVSFAGLPSFYEISSGDMFAFTYGSAPTRYALHRFVTGGTESGGGIELMECVPSIRAGASVGASVTLIRPAMKAIVSDVDFGSGRGLYTEGASFRFVQTFR